MMKRRARYGILGLALFAASCGHSGEHQAHNARDSFYVSGKLTGLDNGWVVLSYRDSAGQLVNDSSQAQADSFRFSGVQPSVLLYTLSIPGEEDQLLRFFVHNGQISITGSKDSVFRAAVHGSEAQEVYRSYQALLAPFEEKSDTLNQEYQVAYSTGDRVAMATLDARADTLDSLASDQIIRFVKAHPTSVVSAWAIAEHFLFVPDAGRLSDLYGSLKGAALANMYARKVKQGLDIARTLVKGKPAPAFSLPDTAGRTVSLASLKGQYVLIDFWASWCEPCRAENPHVVQAFRQYHGKGFTVLGVSLDEHKESWLKAIHHDRLNWTQVSDLKGWKNAVAVQYGIRSIPANFLIDPSGMILGQNLRGSRLDKKLKEILK